MRCKILTMTLLCGAIALAACDGVDSPSQTARDISEARQETRDETRDVQREAAERRSEAAADVAGTEAEATFEIAKRRIEGEHRITVEQCEALTGDAQAQCKDAADARRDAAIEQAEEQRQRATP